MNPAAEHLVDEGTSLYKLGDVEQAKERYQQALRHDPGHARANFNLGVILHGANRTDEAIIHFRRAVESRPQWPAALVNLGNALKDQGDLTQASELYARALEIDPSDLPALHNLGSVAYLRKDYQQAHKSYQAALALGSEEAQLGLANTLREMGQLVEATKLYEAILARNPERADVYCEFGIALEKAGQPIFAARRYAQALEKRPDYIPAMHRRGALLMSFGDPENAEPLYRRILELRPGDLIALNNLAKIALDSGNDAVGRALLEQVIAGNPDFAPARWNLAHVELRAQRFVQAWNAYEFRFRVNPLDANFAPDIPFLVSVEEAQGKRLGVRAEQGLGDQVLFTTLLPELVAQEVELVVELNRKLVPSYQRCFPSIRWIEQVPNQAPPFGGCHLQTALGSLPRHFRPSLESFDRQPPSLLRPDSNARDAFAEQIEKGEPTIGISWHSFQPTFRRGVEEQKSIPLERFAVLPGQLVDLQYGDLSAERATFDDRHPYRRIELDGLDATNNIESLLAAIALCDVVVTCCNFTAHLAGALGKRTYVLYLRAHPPMPFWTARSDGRSLWYPSVRIATDPKWTRWEPIFEWLTDRLRSPGDGGA